MLRQYAPNQHPHRTALDRFEFIDHGHVPASAARRLDF